MRRRDGPNLDDMRGNEVTFQFEALMIQPRVVNRPGALQPRLGSKDDSLPVIDFSRFSAVRQEAMRNLTLADIEE